MIGLEPAFSELRRRRAGLMILVVVGGDMLDSGGGTGENLELLEFLSIGDGEGDGESYCTVVRSRIITSI